MYLCMHMYMLRLAFPTLDADADAYRHLVCVRVCLYASFMYMSAYVCVCMHARIHVCMQVMCVHMYVCMYVCMYVYMYVCAHVSM
jgi:hypothetical protein